MVNLCENDISIKQIKKVELWKNKYKFSKKIVVICCLSISVRRAKITVEQRMCISIPFVRQPMVWIDRERERERECAMAIINQK